MVSHTPAVLGTRCINHRLGTLSRHPQTPSRAHPPPQTLDVCMSRSHKMTAHLPPPPWISSRFNIASARTPTRSHPPNIDSITPSEHQLGHIFRTLNQPRPQMLTQPHPPHAWLGPHHPPPPSQLPTSSHHMCMLKSYRSRPAQHAQSIRKKCWYTRVNHSSLPYLEIS